MGLRERARQLKEGFTTMKSDGLLARAAALRGGGGAEPTGGLLSRAAALRGSGRGARPGGLLARARLLQEERLARKGLMAKAAGYAEPKKKIADEPAAGAEIEPVEPVQQEQTQDQPDASGIEAVQDALDRKVLDLTNLFEISKEITATLEIEDLLNVIIFTTMGQMGVQKVYLCSEDKRGNFPLRAQKGLQPEVCADTVFFAESEVVGLFSQHTRPLTCDEFAAKLPLSDQEQLKALETELLVPLVAQDKLSGLIGLGGRYTGTPFMQEELDFMATLASMAAIALENARLYTNLKDKLNQFSALYDISRIINSSTAVDEVLQLAAETMTTGFALSRAVLLGGESQGFPVLLNVGFSNASMAKYDPSPAAEVFREVLDGGDAVDFPEYKNRPELTGLFCEEDLAAFQSFLLIPLLAAGRRVGLLGVFAVHGRNREPFSREEKELFSIIASQMAPPLLVSSMIEEQGGPGGTFASLRQRVAAQYAHAEEYSLSMGAAMLVLRGLGGYAHQAAEAESLIKKAAAAIQGSLPSQYLAIRSGFAEFTILLPGIQRDSLSPCVEDCVSAVLGAICPDAALGVQTLACGLIPENFETIEEFFLHCTAQGG